MTYLLDFLDNQHDTATNAVLQNAKDSGMEGKVHVVSCGLENQMMNMKNKILDSMESGHWCVIQNIHLVTEWANDIIELLRVSVIWNYFSTVSKKYTLQHTFYNSFCLINSSSHQNVVVPIWHSNVFGLVKLSKP